MQFIDLESCCMEGLDIVHEKAVSFGNEHVRYMDARNQEKEHLKVCSVCNPSLLLEKFFKEPVFVLEGK